MSNNKEAFPSILLPTLQAKVFPSPLPPTRKRQRVDQLDGLPGGSVVKNLPANAGDTGDVGSISGSGRSPGEGMATHSSILGWRIPWTGEPGGPQSTGSQRVGHD